MICMDRGPNQFCEMTAKVTTNATYPARCFCERFVTTGNFCMIELIITSSCIWSHMKAEILSLYSSAMQNHLCWGLALDNTPNSLINAKLVFFSIV